MDKELIPAVRGRQFVMMAEGIIAVLEGEDSARTSNGQSPTLQHAGVRPSNLMVTSFRGAPTFAAVTRT